MYLFDVDGTLTDSLQEIDPTFKEFFKNWMKGKKVFLISGSDLPKTRKQVGEIVDEVDGVFSNAGNSFVMKDITVYEHKWNPPEDLIRLLQKLLKQSDYPVGSICIEPRIGMINFCVCGRESNLEQREKYFEWDNEHKQRNHFARRIKQAFPEIEAVIGGKVSLDIYPKGKDKSQVLKFLIQKYHEPINFFGDHCYDGGNDSRIADIINRDKCGRVFQVKGWQNLFDVLQLPV